jgi:hypothetical protein
MKNETFARLMVWAVGLITGLVLGALIVAVSKGGDLCF